MPCETPADLSGASSVDTNAEDTLSEMRILLRLTAVRSSRSAIIEPSGDWRGYDEKYQRTEYNTASPAVVLTNITAAD